jgi:hypothetical protein
MIRHTFLDVRNAAVPDTIPWPRLLILIQDSSLRHVCLDAHLSQGLTGLPLTFDHRSCWRRLGAACGEHQCCNGYQTRLDRIFLQKRLVINSFEPLNAPGCMPNRPNARLPGLSRNEVTERIHERDSRKVAVSI